MSALAGPRKAAHLAFFAPAFLLPYTTPGLALTAALFLIPLNAWGLPRLLPVLFPPHRGGGGRLEAVHYPMALAACLLAAALRPSSPPGFRWYLVPAAAWYALAVLDGLLGPAHALFAQAGRLPWNPHKTWTGWAVGSVTAALPAVALWRAFVSPAEWWLPALACAVLGLVESVWFRVDDNFTVPFAAMLGMVLVPSTLAPSDFWLRLAADGPWLLLPLGGGILALAGRKLTAGGAVCGGLCSVLLITAQPGLFAFVALLFGLGVGATRFRLATKQRRGLAQGDHGRRGAAEVFGSIGMATWMTTGFFAGAGAVWPARAWLVCAAPLVAKTMDTVSSEIGKALGGPTIQLWPPRRCAPGTAGGVSPAGIFAGLIAAGICAALILPLHWGHAPQWWTLLAIAFIANAVESVYGSWVRRRGWEDGVHANLLLTLTAAALAYLTFFVL